MFFYFDEPSRNKYWYIRMDTTFFNNKDGYEIVSGRKPRLNTGDKVIFIDQQYFKLFGTIRSVEIKELGENKYLTQLYFSQIEELRQPYYIYDYAYSLPKIYKHFKNPLRHFIRSYGKLSYQEYDTIINRKIFISRTAFGKLFNSLHIEHRKAFLRQLYNNNSELHFQKNFDFVELYHLLKRYIQDSILNHYTFLQKSIEFFEELKINSTTLGFTEPKIEGEQGSLFPRRRKVDNILKQLESNKFIETDIKKLDFILSGINEFAQSENTLNELFKNVPLPIDLTS